MYPQVFQYSIYALTLVLFCLLLTHMLGLYDIPVVYDLYNTGSSVDTSVDTSIDTSGTSIDTSGTSIDTSIDTNTSGVLETL